MKVTIRKTREKDFPAVLSLIEELALFVKKSGKVKNSVVKMKKEKNFFQCIVAENKNKEIIGEAIYSFSYDSWNGKILYLDDLCVTKLYRGKKIGTKLMQKIFEIAKKENCNLIHLQVRKSNKSAIEFYKKCGASFEDDLIDCYFDKRGR